MSAIMEIVSRDFLGKVTKRGDWKIMAQELEERLKKKPETKKIRGYFKQNYIFKVAENGLKGIFDKELKNE